MAIIYSLLQQKFPHHSVLLVLFFASYIWQSRHSLPILQFLDEAKEDGDDDLDFKAVQNGFVSSNLLSQ